jgi:hypothetical protein
MSEVSRCPPPPKNKPGCQLVPFIPTVPFYLEVTRNFMLRTQVISRVRLFAILMHTTLRCTKHTVPRGGAWLLRDTERSGTWYSWEEESDQNSEKKSVFLLEI